MMVHIEPFRRRVLAVERADSVVIVVAKVSDSNLVAPVNFRRH